MTKVVDRIFIGINTDCSKLNSSSKLAIVHACEYPCYGHIAFYRTNTLADDHPDHLYIRDRNNLYLNILSTPTFVLYEKVRTQLQVSFDFIDERIKEDHDVLIHSNNNISRAPLLLLCYMATRDLLPKRSYQSAKAMFIRKFEFYQPNKYMERFIDKYWGEIIDL